MCLYTCMLYLNRILTIYEYEYIFILLKNKKIKKRVYLQLFYSNYVNTLKKRRLMINGIDFLYSHVTHD